MPPCRAGDRGGARCEPGQAQGPWPGPPARHSCSGDRWPITPQRPEPVDQGLTETECTWGGDTGHQQCKVMSLLSEIHCFIYCL